MIGGQVIDVKETGHAVSKDVLDTIYELKTGALIECANDDRRNPRWCFGCRNDRA